VNANASAAAEGGEQVREAVAALEQQNRALGGAVDGFLGQLRAA
jgi:hypothetical protein